MTIRPQRWHLHPAQPELAAQLAQHTGLHPLLAQVLLNRGIGSPTQAEFFLDPDRADLPDPSQDFPDLDRCVERLEHGIRDQERIAICGDYDADGMTSTALLLRTLRHFGAEVNYEIPSRMTEGYGLNCRMVQDLHAAGTRIILTVDNGITAHEPVAFARELGLSVLITDHHDLPPQLPSADAILNPKRIPATSPYRGMAGVGIAYLLALALAERLGARPSLEHPLLELLTLGTIADLAPLTGVNRRWVRAGLKLLPTSQIPGIRALLRVSGLDRQSLKPEAIGFGLGPRINAVGRLGQPQVVIDLLTCQDPEQAESLAQECERLNQERQRLCQVIEQAAIAQVEGSGRDLAAERVLTVLGQSWHHGVIGIVASRLVERYGAPVFIAAQEGEDLRGSARGIPEFDVFEALEACQDCFLKHGGHPAAGGFSMRAERWPQLEQGLRDFAQSCLQPDHILPLVRIDAEATLTDLSLDLFDQIQHLQPCGLGNDEPVFVSRGLQVVSQQRIGKDKSHLKFQVRDGSGRTLSAIAWRAAASHPLPNQIDLAYALKTNLWQGEVALQLESKGIRLSAEIPLPQTKKKKNQSPTPPAVTSTPSLSEPRLVYRQAPPLAHALEWHDLPRLSAWLPDCQGTVLLYGFRRPQVILNPETKRDPDLALHYDRPQPGSAYNHIILWSWPPSLTHLRWLLSSAQPATTSHQIHLHRQIVPLLAGADLVRQLQTHLQEQDHLDLLRLAQQWWLSPATLVAGLRSLGCLCPDFDPTGSVSEELDKLQRWYTSPWQTIAPLLKSDP